ncbi:leucine-rich repeat domain-containing protein [Nodosilinea sp. LEGE 06152]|uniref:COR domain-containing protein n=1 Tax=Nodosilinea sp. LEGE 06152 TaxID=2777966 RepID=UPI0018829009|nr:COR domain-containing protein [Nodosilinea sp. LEGE 06152]MBE9160543.1 leucine-rich repeat domain-containing protein [Nodosilinea sp. LEGE 06152]
MSSSSRGFLASPEGLKLLQAAKAERGWTFAAIAERAGVSADTVSRLFHPERGKRVSGDSVRAIAGVLGVEVDAIALGAADPDPLAEAERRIQAALESGATELDLSGLGMTAIPESLGNLINLIALDLSQNQLTAIPDNLGQLTKLAELDLSQNQLAAIPASFGKLTNLTILDLTDNQLTKTPKELGELVKLEGLILQRNQLKLISPETGKLVNLKQLILSQNKLKTIPKELGGLIELRRLSIFDNELKSIPKELGKLSNLATLFLPFNELTDLPIELGRLTHLKELNISHNRLELLPKVVEKLTSLENLDLRTNRLTILPQELGNLKELIRLDLGRNQLQELPANLEKLINLKELCLGQNKLTEIPSFVRKLTRLERLEITNSELSVLPHFLQDISSLKALFIHGNEKLGIPNEILGPTHIEVDKGATTTDPQDILKYYFEILSSRQPLNEAKLILVGFGTVGKTSLVNRLTYQRFDSNSAKTEGIQITQWPIRLNDSEDITLHMWDFGGQEIMHSTHQFFLTERSLYLLVLNGRQGHEDADAEYWLELIQSFGGNSPTLVVLNKIKEHPFDVNRGALQQKFPNIREFIATDCETGQGIDHLRAAIERETDALEHLRDPFPASWVAIKDRLSAMAENYISFEQFREFCKTDGETDYGAQNSLAVHLHSLGIALNYKDDPRLRDTHVLNPHWVTSGIYTLLNADELAETKGELEAACLSRHLDAQNYPPERHGFLLDLMRKFELCFRFEEDENRYLIPDLLDKQQPTEAAEFEPAQCLNFRYQYPILPEGLLPRFIVRTHVLSEHQLRWRTGVILHFEGDRALVKADPQDRSVSISVDGPISSRRRLLAVIRSDFDRIHRSFKFTPKELVPVPGHPGIALPYKDLIVMEESRLTEFPQVIDGQVVRLNIRDLLNGVDLEGTRQPTTAMDRHSQALRLFFSYSHKDDLLREQLETHLKLLQRQGLIQPWHDRRILPGDDWAGDIDDNLNRADVILLLVSADFIASDYCYDIEMKRAMERHESGEARVIPIILRPVDWRDTPFNKLSWLPQNGTPVVQWENRDAAWLDVETGIKRVIQSKLGR